MKTRFPKVMLLFITSLSGLLSKTSHADPSTAADSAFRHLGLEMRAIGGLAPSFGKVAFFGGDGHLLIEGEQFAVLLGGRLLTDSSSRQVAVGEAGARYFPERLFGLFGGGGLFYGAEYVDDLAFAIGHVGGAYAEAGMELPRAWLFRFTGSLRADLGYAAKTEFSRIEPTPTFTMLSLNVGFFLGGQGTSATSSSTTHRASVPSSR